MSFFVVQVPGILRWKRLLDKGKNADKVVEAEFFLASFRRELLHSCHGGNIERLRMNLRQTIIGRLLKRMRTAIAIVQFRDKNEPVPSSQGEPTSSGQRTK
jgi:hypothetical protein